MKVGDLVIWIDEDLVSHKTIITKIKRDNQLDLEYTGVDPVTKITNAPHKSVQHPDYGCYWITKEEADL